MGFPASQIIPADAYEDAKRLANNMKANASRWETACASDVSADDAWLWCRESYTLYNSLLEKGAVPGILAYAVAQELENDPTITEQIMSDAWSAMTTSIQAVYTWIYNALPRDIDGYLLTHKTVGAALVPRTFAPAAMAPLVTLLQTVQANID
jgi:hypothetical protein